MNEFTKKRDSLEKYIQEQIIGPGAYNKKYFFINNWEQSEYSGKNISEIPALLNYDEIIPEVPAYQYSSAILFPVSVTSAEIETNNIGLEIPEEDETETLNTSADDEDLADDTASNVVLTQQNYPNAFGLSFVFDKNKNIEKDVEVYLSYRKYKRISKKDLLEKKISIHIKEYKEEIKQIVTDFLNTAFDIEEKDSNLFVYPKRVFNQEDIYSIDYNLLNQYVHQQFIPILSQTFNKELDVVDSKKEVKYFGLKTPKIQFYSLSTTKHSHSDVYTIFTDSISSYIQKELELGIDSYTRYKSLIRELEIYNQIIQLSTDLKTIIKEHNASPTWQSEQFTKMISLPAINGTQIQREKRQPVDTKDKESLQYYVQYVTKAKENKVYAKLLIENTNQYRLNPDETPQLNKKDGANKISFFGVKLRIQEKSHGTLLQYNPPQLLDFDEEDSFNKLIYRNYIDYGEGYNTSVDWGKTAHNCVFISTEFLPSQETPSVDFKPSKIVANEVQSWLSDDGILSMRFLSTLSEISDDEIIEGLNSFIDAYGKESANSWINKKQRSIDNEKTLDSKSKLLLNKQLGACRSDYSRLKRNIALLQKHKEAICAFRTMNTAMFMQLHHSIKSKEEPPYVFKGMRSEDYYSQVTLYDKNSEETDYKWRSFQLAFILLNIDGFVKPDNGDNTVEDVFGSGWPERNEIADLVWFPTGGGKTEAYLGIIAFTIAFRRFTQGERGHGTTVLMRYTLRMLTLQQFQRATILICALEVIRKNQFSLGGDYTLGGERITIGLFVGGDSLPNYWTNDDKSMLNELRKISDSITNGQLISTNLPFTNCPWCGGELFISENLNNVSPNHTPENSSYGLKDQLNIACNTTDCAFHSEYASNEESLPLRLFDEDIYKSPPTLLFGTVDKFAALANNISSDASGRNKDSRRLIGQGYRYSALPPELIIQDELHLLLGPLGSSVALFEKGIDQLCTYVSDDGKKVKPKIVTSTATTRNTDKQIFALFNRRSEIFPKQGITCDDSFFSFYKRKTNKDGILEVESKRKYLGVLPVGKTQVWMQLRVISICLCHRLKYFKQLYTMDDVFESPEILENLKQVFNYYHTVLAYYNSIKDVGKAQSQLDHYLPGDINYISKNTMPWSFLEKLIRNEKEINYSELTGRLTGEQVKTHLSDIEKKWSFLGKKDDSNGFKLNKIGVPEFVISTNMISVGIDVSRFNTMVINSMPRNIAEYIQASSRVARDEDGIVFTIHHPFRSRDISHYQKFKEFHEKFYSYVEPISVTPFASKALDRYLAMYAIVVIRHNEELGLMNNEEANQIDNEKIKRIKDIVHSEIHEIYDNAKKLDKHLQNRATGVVSTIDGIISQEELDNIENKLSELLEKWIRTIDGKPQPADLAYRIHGDRLRSLFISALDENYPNHWKVSYSLREIGASSVIKTVQQ